MATAPSSTIQLDPNLFNLDLDFRNRQLAAQIAQEAATLAFQQKRMELIDQGLMQFEADKFAKEYALEIGKNAFQQDLANRQFGLSVEGQAFQQRLDQQRQTFEQSFREREFAFTSNIGLRQQSFEEHMATQNFAAERQNALELQKIQAAELSGMYNGQQTLQLRQQLEQQRQYNLSRLLDEAQMTGIYNGQQTLDKQRMNEMARQFGLTHELDTQRFRQQQGEFAATHAEGQRQFNTTFGEDQRQFNLGFGEDQRQFNVDTVVNAPKGAADTPAYFARLRGLQQKGALPGVIGSFLGGQPVAGFSSGGQATPRPATHTDLASTAVGYGGSVFDPDSSASVTQNMFQTGMQAPPTTLPSGSDWSAQEWRNLSPEEQDFTLGLNQEVNAQAPRDAIYSMMRAAPTFQRSGTGRFGF